MKVTKQINATSNEKSQNYNAESHKVTNLKILLKLKQKRKQLQNNNLK